MPAWEAVIEHVPAITGVSVVPLTVQIRGVVLVNATAVPAPAVAVSEYEAAVAFNELVGVKVIVCAAFEIMIDFVTLLAAAYLTSSA